MNIVLLNVSCFAICDLLRKCAGSRCTALQCEDDSGLTIKTGDDCAVQHSPVPCYICQCPARSSRSDTMQPGRSAWLLLLLLASPALPQNIYSQSGSRQDRMAWTGLLSVTCVAVRTGAEWCRACWPPPRTRWPHCSGGRSRPGWGTPAGRCGVCRPRTAGRAGRSSSPTPPYSWTSGATHKHHILSASGAVMPTLTNTCCHYVDCVAAAGTGCAASPPPCSPAPASWTGST